MNQQEEAVLRLTHQQNIEKRRAEDYEAACKRVVGGFLSAADVCRLFAENNGWRDTPGANARRLIAENHLPFLEVGPGRFSVGHSLAVQGGAA